MDFNDVIRNHLILTLAPRFARKFNIPMEDIKNEIYAAFRVGYRDERSEVSTHVPHVPRERSMQIFHNVSDSDTDSSNTIDQPSFRRQATRRISPPRVSSRAKQSSPMRVKLPGAQKGRGPGRAVNAARVPTNTGNDVGYQISNLTIPQLKNLALNQNIQIPSKIKRKADIIIFIETNQPPDSDQHPSFSQTSKDTDHIPTRVERVQTTRNVIATSEQPQIHTVRVHRDAERSLSRGERSEGSEIQPKTAHTLNKRVKNHINFEGVNFTSKSDIQWNIGSIIGSGGFGVLYNVTNIGGSARSNSPMVIKLEPEKGGSLFLETSVYRHIQDPAKNESKYGIPSLIDSGFLDSNKISKIPLNIKYRYVILPKFDYSLQDLIDKKHKFSQKEIDKVINDVMTSLEYIHGKGYLHLDLKPENIMKGINNKWFLIDYGMAKSYNQTNENVINKKEAGNGTPYYMARDAHIGRMSRKTDVESLTFIVFQLLKNLQGEKMELIWMKPKLPKETKQNYEHEILQQKIDFFNNVGNQNVPDKYVSFAKRVDEIIPGFVPNYRAIDFD